MSSSDLIKRQAEKWISKSEITINKSEASTVTLTDELSKLKKEEQKYVKIYGAELITLEQLEDALKEIRLKRNSIEKQVEHFSNSAQKAAIIVPSHVTIDEHVKKARKALRHLDFEVKQKIIRRCIDKIVTNQKEMTVDGYLPLESEVGLRAISRNCWSSQCWQVDFVQRTS